MNRVDLRIVKLVEMLDKDGYEVPDYELPNKNMLKMTWNDESGIAKDNRGRTYEIINY